MALAGRKRRLVLHFDVNETIMVGDPASDVDFDSCLNHILAKVAFLNDQQDAWHDGSPLELSKREEQKISEVPPLLTSFDAEQKPRVKCYEANRRNARWPSSKFTDEGLPGQIYRSHYEELKEALRWRHGPNQTFAPAGQHFLLPAFFHTLSELEKQGRDFCVVIRTFGTDLPEVAQCLQAFARGEHPDFPAGLPRFDLASEDARWVLQREDRTLVESPICLRRYDEYLGTDGLGHDLKEGKSLTYSHEVGPDAKVLEFILSKPIIAIRDDYHHWRHMKYIPESGKPLWISPDDDVHHIFFDDNIHNKAHDSIVAVRARTSGDSFEPVSGEATRQLEGVLLVKAHAVEAIRDHNYFLKEIDRCEENLAKHLEDGTLQRLLSLP